MWIDEDVEKYFLSSPIAPLLEVGDIANSRGHPIHDSLRKSLALVPDSLLRNASNSVYCKEMAKDQSKVETENVAREWAIIEELNSRICHRRRKHLVGQSSENRPAPYNESELSDLEISEDKLVPLSEFDVEAAVLLRNGSVFTVLPSTPDTNSSYWITKALTRCENRRNVLVRLDPLIYGIADDFPRMEYKIHWWGPHLFWESIFGIRRIEFGRWGPVSLNQRSEFTDYAMVPDGDIVSLYLEELPKLVDIGIAGSRYFHAIFSKSKECVIHLDGAIRIYTEDGWNKRKETNVFKAGKSGIRVKVFRIDGLCHLDSVANLGGNFFFGNYDVMNFFGASFPSVLLGESIK